MEYDSKGSDDWNKMVIGAHADRWAGFTFNPTPLDLVSNDQIRAVGRVVDALYTDEFRKMVAPLNALYPIVSDVSSNIVAVLAERMREPHSLDGNKVYSFMAAIEGELTDSINSSPLVDAARKEALCEIIESVTHNVKCFLSRATEETKAHLAEEKRVGVSCIPGDPSMRDLHKLYYPPAKQGTSAWQRLAGALDRRPANADSADVVGAPREDVPLVEHVYAEDGFDSGNE